MKPSSPKVTMRKTTMTKMNTTKATAAVVVDNPERFMCPLSMSIMNDPVVTPYGDNFQRRIIEKYLKKNGEVCPINGKPLKLSDLMPNSKLQWEVLYWQRHATTSSSSLSSSSSHNRHSSDTAAAATTTSESSTSSPRSNSNTTSRRSSMIRQDSFMDAAPRQPRRSSRCDKTLCLDLSEHDILPSVPRRKNSDHDLSKTFMLACQQSLEASCGSSSTSSCFSSKLQDSNNNKKCMQSMALNDFMTSFAMGSGDLRNEDQYSSTRRSLSSSSSDPTTSILSVLDEVEQTIALDLFA